ncbi:tetratricopeptide repeat protein [Stakelama sediminis]|uniref:tetratricopeptide repeat protein n=1 Tax=Stakelama sediminis TaxID=463200 RepID=UPI001617526E
MVTIAAGAASMTLISVPASAQDAGRYANAALTKGDYTTAERQLLADYAAMPDRQEVLLNLATLYAYTGRAEQARILYEKVLSRPDVLMNLANGRSAHSYDLARAGIAKLPLHTSAASYQ